ncbi:unnamed protein product [Rhizoctonia solani]|uniref:Uncharacterized protein n=1 Tax=Rhizoctonia solani TaxID=456999 RepID=A0A8H3E2R5_9AGAM|nr:unnamed protein product [Rhizoctonia solani]
MGTELFPFNDQSEHKPLSSLVYPLLAVMNPQNISTQPTRIPKMQMTIEQAQVGESRNTENLASRVRGGGAAKASLIGALSCFICCERVSFVVRAKYAALAAAE